MPTIVARGVCNSESTHCMKQLNAIHLAQRKRIVAMTQLAFHTDFSRIALWCRIFHSFIFRSCIFSVSADSFCSCHDATMYPTHLKTLHVVRKLMSTFEVGKVFMYHHHHHHDDTPSRVSLGGSDVRQSSLVRHAHVNVLWRQRYTQATSELYDI